MTEVGRDQITIELDALADEIENTMKSTNLAMPPQRCIFKVPNILKRHNPKAYAPNAFSLGPYHDGNEHLKATQNIKLKYLDDLISRFEDPKAMLRTLIGAISEVQEEARGCYAEPIDHISRNEFVKILVVDGCFLIELFRKSANKNLQRDDDPVFTTSCMTQNLCHDLILVENQIPWQVLENLFKITRKPGDLMASHLSDLVLEYCFRVSIPLWRRHRDVELSCRSFHSGEHGSKHILDLLRNLMVLPFERKPDAQNLGWPSMPSATTLREAGIKFKKGGSISSLDVKFNDGVLEIRPLFIAENTESLFRNLICLEQCLPNCSHEVTSYAILLDNLINTTEDMEILCNSGIIDNWLNIDDATKFFNQLYDDTFVKEFYYSHLIVKVNKYCQRRWPRHRTVLMHDYFNNPWALVSVIAATILLILTFLQTLLASFSSILSCAAPQLSSAHLLYGEKEEKKKVNVVLRLVYSVSLNICLNKLFEII